MKRFLLGLALVLFSLSVLANDAHWFKAKWKPGAVKPRIYEVEKMPYFCRPDAKGCYTPEHIDYLYPGLITPATIYLAKRMNAELRQCVLWHEEEMHHWRGLDHDKDFKDC